MGPPRREARLVDEGVLVPRYEPYSLVDTLRVYAFGWNYWGGSCGLVGLWEGCAALVCDAGVRVEYRVYCAGRPEGDAAPILEWVLGLVEDTRPYLRLARGDPLVGGVAEAMPGLRLRSTSVWAALLTAVCQQNASFRQGWGMLYRLHLAAGPRLILPDGRVYIEAPGPRLLGEDVLRAAGLGYRARTVLEAARLFAESGEPSCRDVDVLAGVRGVGPYTLRLVRLLACRDYREPPVDRWLAALAARAYGLEGGGLRAAERVLRERFGEWAGLAAWHATIAFDAQPLRRALERLERGVNRPGVEEPSPVSLWRVTPPEPFS